MKQKNEILNKIKNFIKTKVGIAVLFLIVIMGLFLLFKNGSSNDVSLEVKSGTFEKVVSISGKVVPAESVDLAFESSGTVARVYKDVGQTVNKGEVIASLDSSDIVALRDMAKADLLTAEAELAKVVNSGSNSDVSINKAQVVNAIIEAYTKSDDAVRNKVDQFFDNPRTSGPEIKYTFYNYFSTKDKINNGREDIEKILVDFGSMADSITVDNYSESKLKNAKLYVQKVKMFLDLVSFAVNSFEESYTLTSSMISSYRADVATARTNVSAVLTDLTSYEDKLRGSISDISIYEAKVKSKEANIRNYDAQIAKTIIFAPFTGVISSQEAKVGESVSQNTKLISMIGNNYEVEAYIPEVNISGIALKNPAKIKLDAYGDLEFKATIIHIDPAETIRDGVSNYKIKLAFDEKDSRILSGMTADIQIVTLTVSNVYVVPERTIFVENDKSYVIKLDGKDSIKTEVTLGKKDGKGNIIVESGLNEGVQILLNPEK